MPVAPNHPSGCGLAHGFELFLKSRSCFVVSELFLKYISISSFRPTFVLSGNIFFAFCTF